MILQQKRTHELIYGIFCKVFFSPSSVNTIGGGHFTEQIIKKALPFILQSECVSRSELVRQFGKDFAVDSLPNDFIRCRRESIVHVKNLLIIGEYGNNSGRIFIITQKACTSIDYYNHFPGVRHIHSVHEYKEPGMIIIATGDTKKLLDLWAVTDCKVIFVKGIKKYLAGYTAAVKLNGEIYLGTDFSNRPNYIETLKGKKFFYPEIAYKQWVIAFSSVFNRYILSINAEGTEQRGGNKTFSIFDVCKEQFIYCNYAESVLTNYA